MILSQEGRGQKGSVQRGCKRCRRKRLGGGLSQWQIVHGGSWPCLLGDEMCPREAAISEARLGAQRGLGGADNIVSPSSTRAQSD